MANPNIVAVTSIYGKSVQAALTTTLTTEILACASDKLQKITSILTISVPADSTLVVIDKNSTINLQEGDNIEAGAGATSDAVITINYDELDDA